MGPKINIRCAPPVLPVLMMLLFLSARFAHDAAVLSVQSSHVKGLQTRLLGSCLPAAGIQLFS